MLVPHITLNLHQINYLWCLLTMKLKFLIHYWLFYASQQLNKIILLFGNRSCNAWSIFYALYFQNDPFDCNKKSLTWNYKSNKSQKNHMRDEFQQKGKIFQ